jgi:penicillin amidase
VGRIRTRGMSQRFAILGAVIALVATITVPGAAAATGHAAASRPMPAGGTAVGHGTDRAVIVRDSYGVPSIYSKSTAGMWFGAGWAQAQDRLVQLELTRRAVEGTLSQIFGPSELSQDETVRTLFYTPAELRAQYRSMPASARAAVTAFAKGINAYENAAYASASSEQADVPYEFFALGQLLGQSGPRPGARSTPSRWATSWPGSSAAAAAAS